MDIYFAYKKTAAHLNKWFPLYLIVTGIIFRLDQYLFNRSLWLDETFLATSIANGTLSDFFAPQEYSHIVPTGFLVLVKAIILQYGNNDFIIRLLPFSAGIISLFLFKKVGEKYISYNASLIALFLFVISDRLIFYSSDLKPYATDVLVTLILLYTIACIQLDRLNFRETFLLTVSGAVAVWFSHPSIFILAGIGAYLGVIQVQRKEWGQLSKLAIIFAGWCFSFLIIYILYIKDYDNPWLTQFWGMLNSFIPFPPSFATIKWLGIKFIEIFQNPGGFIQEPLPVAFIAGILFLWGCFSLFNSNRVKLLILMLPIFFAIAASAFKVFPVHGRMIIFFLPSVYLLIAEGIACIPIKNKILKNISIIIVLMFICYNPFYTDIFHLKHPRVVEEVKPALKYVRANMQADDVVYVYYWTEPAFRYYADAYSFDYNQCALISPEPDNEYIKEVDYFRRSNRNVTPRRNGFSRDIECVIGISEEFGKCKNEIDQLRGNKRVWFIFTHSNGADFLKYLDKIGTRIDENLQPGAAVYLYNLETNELIDQWRSANQSKVQRNGLLAEFLFNGNAKDSSGNPNHGTVIGAELTADRFGNSNSAYQFKGDSANKLDEIIIVKHDDIFNQNEMTLSVWLNGEYPKGFARIIDMLRWDKKEGYSLRFEEIDGGKIAFEYFDVEGQHCLCAKTNSALKNGEWQHIVFTFNGRQSKIYYNGVQEDIKDTSCNTMMPTSRFLSIGNGYDDNAYWPFKGKIDDVRIYNRALTNEEIEQLYNEKN